MLYESAKYGFWSYIDRHHLANSKRELAVESPTASLRWQVRPESIARHRMGAGIVTGPEKVGRGSVIVAGRKYGVVRIGHREILCWRSY